MLFYNFTYTEFIFKNYLLIQELLLSSFLVLSLLDIVGVLEVCKVVLMLFILFFFSIFCLLIQLVLNGIKLPIYFVLISLVHLCNYFLSLFRTKMRLIIHFVDCLFFFIFLFSPIHL